MDDNLRPASPPAPTPLRAPFRLTEDWYRNNVARLQARLEENGLDGIILENVWNIIYFSGLFHTQTERPLWLFVPQQGNPVFFHPAVDGALIDTWWVKDSEWYFDYPHHGDFNRIGFEPGPPQDLLQWMLSSLSKRGYSRATLGIETEVGSSVEERMRAALPGATFKVAGELCAGMRVIKTPEEIVLLQKALDFQDHLLEYARSLILANGTKVTDFEIELETKRYATHELMKSIQPDGSPHTGVGIYVGVSCRAGRSTAYPHPNQIYYHRIERGDAIQIAGWVHIGGYAGECYRAIQTYPITDLQKKAWRVHTEMTQLQARLCRSGSRCNDVACRILRVARDSGLERFIFHRPGHGIGMEGHQEPCISPGDDTVLREGMVLSSEPGLYNPEEGWGYTHSNTVLVGKEEGTVLCKTPMSESWCWIEVD
jgi:Xaa-Pro dipeptidase